MVYRSNEFNKVVSEYFDISDKETFQYLKSIEEADQNKVMLALTSKLYDHLVDKIDDIDFGDIPKSRGDITRLPNYAKVVDCINIIKQILISSQQSLEPIMILELAVKNLLDYKETFIKGYQLNLELPMVIYNTMVLSVYSGISILISSCIEFIKSPDGTGFDIALDKVQLNKTKDSLLFKDLKALNDSFDHGELPKALDNVIKQKGLVKEAAEFIVAGAAILGVILNIIPILRELTYFFYYSRTKVSDYFDAQSALLQMNAYNLAQRATDDSKDIKEIQSKQLKIADKFKKIANFLSVKKGKAEVEAEKETKKLEKNLKISDVKNTDDSIW